MAERHAGLTAATAAYFEEAARVCLDRHHTSPAHVSIEDDGATHEAQADWQSCDDRTRAAWANQHIATEHGAYAVVLASAELTRDFVAVGRAETSTGADYYVAPTGAGLEDLENCYRLEVSGTDSDDDRDLGRRLLYKIAQARNGDSPLPALAGVVAFPTCRIKLRSVA